MIAFTEADSNYIHSILGPEGLLSQSYPGFESRPEQLAMADAAARCLHDNKHLAVEAGTGVGKSFAYLVAAINQLRRENLKGMISTYTINLQQQLINKDIPFLAEILPDSFVACLAKGKQNYLCRRRLEFASKRQQWLFDDMGMEIEQITQWSRQTQDGSLSDLTFVPSAKVWDTVKSEHGNCKGRKCRYFRECFYRKARRSLDTADLIVANHALLLSDLVLKESSPGILPEFHYVIIDEAHNLEPVAQEHLGISISNFSFTYFLNDLYQPRKRKGLLAYMDQADKARDLVKSLSKASAVFFTQVQAWYDHIKDENNGRCHPEFVDDNVSELIRNLRLSLTALSKQADDEDEQFELTHHAERCRNLEIGLEQFLTQKDTSHIYWVEAGSSNKRRVCLKSAPLDVGPDLKRILFEPYQSVITTSATLSCGQDDDHQGFEFFASNIGLEKYDSLKLGSPFDYYNQVKVYIEADLPGPGEEGFEDAAAEAIKRYLLKSQGRAFLLFTSYTMLKNISGRLTDWLTENDMDMLCQGSGIDRSVLLKTFKEDPRSVLFGTDSFWQGVDVPGEALSNVIIARLPFAVPNHPLIQGKIEKLREEGKNPFFSYQLPNAIIKFKQGFGRLIRTKTDSGIVVLLDSRIVRKTYGKHFLNAVPKAQIEIVTKDD